MTDEPGEERSPVFGDGAGTATGRLGVLTERCAEFFLTADENELGRFVVAAAREVLPQTDAAALVLWRNGEFVVGAVDGYPAADDVQIGASVPFRTGFPFDVMAAGTGVVVDESTPMGSTGGRPPELVGLLQRVCGGVVPASALAVPLVQRGAPLGLLVCDAIHERRAFDGQDLAVAGLLAAHAGAALSSFRTARLAQERFVTAERDRERRATLVGELVREMGHPLGVMRGFLELLAEERLGSIAARYVDLLGRDVARLNRIKNELSQLTRAQTAEPVQAVVAPTAGPIVRRVVDEMRGLAAVDGAAVAPPSMTRAAEAVDLADGPGAATTLRNLLEQAAVLAGPGGTVVVDADADVHAERFRVVVDARGRAAGPSSPDKVDALGVAVVAGLIETLGGRLTIEALPGEGCRFTLSVPTATSTFEGG